MRCDSPPDSVDDRRSSVRYSSPTLLRNVSRLTISACSLSAIAASRGGSVECPEEIQRLAHGHRPDAVDRESLDLHVTRLAPQARSAAVRTDLVGAIAAQEHADVHLVLLALEQREEATDAFVAAVAVHHERALGVGQLLPRHVEPHLAVAPVPLQVGLVPAVLRLGPRVDRALRERLAGIGHHEPEVEFHDVAEAVARRARPKRVVEREQPRLRHLVRDAAGPALEALGEHVTDGRLRDRGTARRFGEWLEREGGAAAFLIRDLQRVGQARQHVGAHLDAVDDDVERGASLERGRSGRRSSCCSWPSSSTRVKPRRRRRLERGLERQARVLPRGAARTPAGLVVVLARGVLVGPGDVHADDRHLEPEQEPRPLAERRQALRHHLGRLADHLAPAVAAVRAADPGEEQPQVVVNLGRGADRAPRVADAVLLPDGDRRRDPVDAVDVGPLHPLEELAGVGRQRLDVAPLPFGVDRVEGERGLARAGDAGDDDQLARRQGDVHLLQVVRAGALDHDVADRRGRRGRHQSLSIAAGNRESGTGSRESGAGCRESREPAAGSPVAEPAVSQPARISSVPAGRLRRRVTLC